MMHAKQIPKLTAENRECYLSIFSCAGEISAYENVMCPDRRPAGMLSALHPPSLLRLSFCLSFLPLISPTTLCCFLTKARFTSVPHMRHFKKPNMSHCPFDYTPTQPLTHKMFVFGLTLMHYNSRPARARKARPSENDGHLYVCNTRFPSLSCW